ncbi:sigma-E factor negative regulatory protein [Endozoicomonas ascidiicola]|uniref:sigma-E factor negative regulatory protein n=1 Tax=Endozoicomonas ascidiicola TaxID=1698521 RepID=UPI0008353457|nr:sigma-E factor negative regulatory protein [Endozoicomonas ascidiicola]
MSEKNSQNRSRERLKESLSATLDGQANDLELRRVLGDLQNDDELRRLAGRYQQISDGIRDETNRFAKVDISSAVMSALENEPDISSSSASDKPPKYVTDSVSGATAVMSLKNGWEYLGKVAMAASVAAALVISVRMLNPEPASQPLALSGEQAVLSQPLQLAQAVGNTGYGATGIRAGYNSRQHATVTPEQLAYAQSIADRATRERFHAYALQHAEYSAVGLGQSLLPFARLTSFDTQ